MITCKSPDDLCGHMVMRDHSLKRDMAETRQNVVFPGGWSADALKICAHGKCRNTDGAVYVYSARLLRAER